MAYIGYIVKDAQEKTLFVTGIKRHGLSQWQFTLTYPEYYKGLDFDPEYLNMNVKHTEQLAKQIKKEFKNTPFEIKEVWGLISSEEMEQIL